VSILGGNVGGERYFYSGVLNIWCLMTNTSIFKSFDVFRASQSQEKQKVLQNSSK
jgi:hypothetical protein